MKLDALLVDLAASLGDAAPFFTDGDRDELPRVLEAAAGALAERRPRRGAATLTLVADQSDYAAPADLLRLLGHSWGAAELAATSPWEANWPGRLPTAWTTEGASGRVVRLTPAPTASQLTQLGTSWPYIYAARHALSNTDGETSVPEAERELLLLRAQAEAVREMALAGTRKPVQLHKGIGSQAAATTAAELWPRLLEEWDARVAA